MINIKTQIALSRFFLFDAAKALEYAEVLFVEKGAAGYKTKMWKPGVDSFAALKFRANFS